MLHSAIWGGTHPNQKWEARALLWGAWLLGHPESPFSPVASVLALLILCKRPFKYPRSKECLEVYVVNVCPVSRRHTPLTYFVQIRKH